ncbi:unnamed protein product [Dovyalis caffra]|uniref:rRNA N-glycosylase n=1 Tax=Dovyalis caffra TaxID=77055 RepID=A0AAV1SIQ3_9ROSI|nr:unnamed protein product [Dovyalis caffra]CAK7352007.1 unnamed protein product [Dovyalis caffra]
MKGVWWIVVIVAALVCPLVIQKTKTLRYNTVTFNFEGATEASYSAFVNSLRNEVKSKVVQGLPVTAKTVPDSKRYVLVDLKIDSQKFITLAIDVTSMYVVGYRDSYAQKDRANFLADAPEVAKKNLFKEAKEVRVTKFTGSYPDLERYAKTGRENIELGVYKLEQAIESVYGKSVGEQIEAKFFIISIQMVSEAARFEYILKKVLEGGIYGSYKPDPKAISLETSWDKISKAIQTADASGKFSSPIILKDVAGKTWTVNQVSDIAKDMGLLKFLA